MSIVVVGNEVLSGKVVEQNAAFLIGRLKTLGARVCEVVFVEDDVYAIAEAMARVMARSDEVLVTGGIGPTHDDVTIQAAAQALGVPVVEDGELLAQIARLGLKRGVETAREGRELTPGERRLARVPAGAKLHWAVRTGGEGVLPWPVARAANMWLFPGVPPLMQALFDGLKTHFSGSPPLFADALELTIEEAVICEALDAIVATHVAVEIGSYPRREANVWHLRLTFESPDAAATVAAVLAARTAFQAYLARA